MRFIVLIFLFISFSTKANTIEVCASCTAKTIKEAIALAEEGDSIMVHKGIYKDVKGKQVMVYQ